ncbi:MAG TPA: hypothetical protein VKS23_08795 [Thermoanaerobaculia bacterium]|nr:hypothetical protein [Thermoanaerobaculia bacterium]
MQEPGGIETARLLPPAGANAPFGLHVVLASEGLERSPFVRLSEADDLARVYLAAVKGDDDSLLELCALKLMPDAWPDGVAPGSHELTNQDLENRWKRERSRLADLNALSPYFPRLVRLDASAGETADRLPPLFYSRAGRSFFVPPCPGCRNPLSLCRDEAWLARTGLPSFASSRERFLWCETCANGSGSPTVYTTSQITTPGATVRSATDLLDDLGHALREVFTEEEAASLVGVETAKAARALRAPNVPGEAGVRDLITPLTFFGSPFLVTVAAPLDLEALADALGGRPWEEFAVRGGGAGGTLPGRWAWLVEAPAPTRRLLFAPESSGLDAVEVFFLKMTAFRQILEGLLDYYRAAGRPHLDLHPRHLLFELSGAGDGLPLFWTFQARIHGLAADAVTLPAPGSPSVVLPGQGLAVPYAAPEIQEFRLAGYRPCELVFTDLDEDGTGSRRFRLRGRVSDAYGLYPSPQQRDTLFLSVPDPTLDFGFTGLAVRATPGEIRSDEVGFASDLLALEEHGQRRLRLALGTKIPGARYRVFPDFGTPSDLHALGVSLLRLLLRNDGQDVAAVLKAADRLSRDVAALAPGEARRSVTLPALLKRVPDAAPVFSKVQVFWSRDDRRSGRPNALPEALWERAVVLALRLVTRVAGFSVAASPADFDPLFREEKLERIVPEVVSLLAEVQSLLFERQSVHLEIQQVLAEIQAAERSSEARR